MYMYGVGCTSVVLLPQAGLHRIQLSEQFRPFVNGWVIYRNATDGSVVVEPHRLFEEAELTEIAMYPHERCAPPQAVQSAYGRRRRVPRRELL